MMSEELKPEAIQEVAGQPNETTQENQETSIAYDKYRKLLDEKKKVQEELQSKAKIAQEYEQKLKKIEEEKLVEQQRYKELFENRDKELSDIKKRLEDEKTAYLEAKKVQEFLRAVGDLKKDSYIKFIDTKKIILNSDGTIDKESLKDYAATFKRDYGELLKEAGAKLPEVAPTNSKGDFSSLKSQDILKILKGG